MALTRPDPNLEAPMDAYVIISDVPAPVQYAVQKIQHKLRDHFGDALWYAPDHALHITLLDWLQPRLGLSYPRDAGDLYKEIEPVFTPAFQSAVTGQRAITLHFDTIELFEAAVIIKAQDQGQYDAVRSAFGEQVTLHPETKPIPKNIIHSSIVRFREAIPLEDVQSVLDFVTLDVTCVVDHFRLVHMTKNLMLEKRCIREFPLL